MTAPMSLLQHMRATLVLGLPLIGGHLAQFAIQLTDTVMLGWYSVEALAAVTLAGSYFITFFLFGAGFAWAVMPMVATFAAKGDQTGVRRATRMGLWLSLLYSALAMPAFWWAEEILLALGQTDAVAGLAADYLRVAGWGIFPALIVMVLKSYLAALERTRIILWVTLAAAVMNVFGNYVLIFGNFGLPPLGAVGAAWASIITHTTALAGAAAYAVIARPEHQLFVRFWRADWEMFFKVFRMGGPIGITTLSEVSLFAGSTVLMGWLGTIPLAAHGIAIQLGTATFMVHLGLSNAATVRAGQAQGRDDGLGLRRGATGVLILSLVVSLITIAVFLSIPEQLLGLFLEPDNPNRPQILAIGVGLVTIAALFQLVDGAQVVALGLLRGLHDTTVPMVMAAVGYWVVGLPASYILGFVAGLGGIGVWLGLVSGLATAAVLLLWRFWGRAVGQVGAAVPV
ncbi:multidrug transporter MatE [Marinibacterium profundimaris]|uniref:Multidrug-efflux transporter n=2 Tax=Marinibacterium profundimaris TaxID=1679460 RepID=A0A225NGR5_9RHOB|nr:multidrug transporter MatE [Marinibacterium profundimaris]